MKTIKIFIGAAGVAGLFALTACNKVLDKQDLTKLTPELVYNDSNLVQLNMDAIYDVNLPAYGGQNTGSALSGLQPQLTDESYSSTMSPVLEGTVLIGSSEVSEFGTGLNTNTTVPTNNWGKIRQLNTFIKSLKEGSLPA